MMKLKIIVTSLFALFMSNAAFSDQQKPSITESVIINQQLEVIAIDHDAGWVQLKDRSGFTKKVNVGNDIINFDQVKVGDVVNVNYAETIVIKAFGADAISAGEEIESVFARAKKGEKPAGAAASATTVVVTIASIDLENSLITLKDLKGNMKTLRPRSPSVLKKIQVGDKVAISFAKALSVKVKAANK